MSGPGAAALGYRPDALALLGELERARAAAVVEAGRLEARARRLGLALTQLRLGVDAAVVLAEVEAGDRAAAAREARQ